LLQGIDALPCEVEVDHDPLAQDKPPMVVGLPDAAVRESVERVRAALMNCGYAVPAGRTLINLAPADLRKEGPIYDLPIALGLLQGQGVIGPGAAGRPGRRGSTISAGEEHASDDEPMDVRRFLVAGELALDGRVRPVRGVIAMASLAAALGLRGVIVPEENAREAAAVPGIEAHGVSTLSQVVGLLTGRLEPEPVAPVDIHSLLRAATTEIDFADVRGQEAVKRAITIAAAGSHNILLLGPAGTGKSMMAQALPGILPPLAPEEAIEITRIYSAAGALAPGQGLVSLRPVRAPHHTASPPAIVGGGAIPRPGEVSLAHRGVLFLDELPEFPRAVLETLRQPLENHVVSIARAHSSVRFPASFMLVAAMNPTPKGDVPRDQVGQSAMKRYLARLSGPLIDRIDIHVEAPAVPWKHLSDRSGPSGTSSAQMRDQVLRARARQGQRQGPLEPNSRLSGRRLDALAPMSESARNLLGQAITELGLSARAYDKIRRVSRTIADLDQADLIDLPHVAEAVQYRLLDRQS
jgi:magnesium chelatase family protein